MKSIKKGKIIILNGVSSSGKTTLAKAIQVRSPIPLYKLDIDDFILMSPEKFNDYEHNDFSVQYAFASKIFHVVKLFSDMGFDMVVPQMFFKNTDTLKEFKVLLKDYPVLIVNITCPVEELNKRELSIGDRNPGSAEEQLQLLETQFDNSITVNTFESTNEECAEMIIKSFLSQNL